MPLYQNQYTGQTVEGETWMFSWWGESASAIDTVHPTSVDWINTFWTGGYDAFCTAGVQVTGVNTREIVQGTGRQVRLRQSAVSLVGASVGATLGADVCIVVSLRTDLANRSGRGRFYLPQPADNTVSVEGRIAASAVTGIVSALTAAWTGVTTVQTPVVYSRVSAAVNEVESFDIGDLFDTQRRRENKLLEARSGAAMPGA